MTGKLHLIGLGGGGINIVADIEPTLANLHDGFSKVDCKFVDTTQKTIHAYPEYNNDEYFTKVTSGSSLDNEIDGQAGLI